jgi:uncharacterized coiled-coil DUF342 family protein
MTDLVDQLRAYAQPPRLPVLDLLTAAADEIERLREQHDLALRVHDAMAAKIERLRKEIEYYADIAEGHYQQQSLADNLRALVKGGE